MNHLVPQNPTDLVPQDLTERAYRIWQVRQSIYADIARSIRKAARSWHVQVDKCARAQYKQGKIVECKRCGFYFKFTVDDAENLIGTFKEEN